MGRVERPDVCEKPNLKQMWGSSYPTPSNLSYIVKRPNGLSQDGFHITMAAYHLEDDLGKCPAYEQSKRIEPEPTEYVPSSVAKLYEPKCALVEARMCAT
ncbi:hypothetical protein CRG98_012161 [Punica granatum]|uniref:Uncharacterized protein n=1 Tax=Punica granatum TaxID=22663 RepID=A0A2I0KGE5_PUNGR|nr:hypothetical protein CRG98_012161 [Punica granatum]